MLNVVCAIEQLGNLGSGRLESVLMLILRYPFGPGRRSTEPSVFCVVLRTPWSRTVD